jgi:alkanesulfonate monooxygenase
MPVEFVGFISTIHESEIHPGTGPLVNAEYLERFAQAHETSSFDRVLIGYSSATPDGLQVASYAASHTDRLSYLIAHRPGFVVPTVAARMLATLDQFSKGRVAVHIISGASEAEQRRDGDYLSKADRYGRSREFMQIIKAAWTATEPFSYDGQFYKLEDFLAQIKPFQQPRIPVYFGGSSPEAFGVGAAEADVFAFFAQPLDQMAAEFDKVRAAAAAIGAPTPGFSVSFRPILGDTEELAWKRAHDILGRTQDRVAAGAAAGRLGRATAGTPSVGSQRQLEAAARGERHDRALWTPLAAATGAAGNSTALVGTAETVAEALLDYVDIGATTLLIRGYDPYDDAVDYGRELIPLVREGVARRERAAALREPAN